MNGKNQLPQALTPFYYNDDRFFNTVSRSLFLNSWQMVGHQSQLKTAGDFFCVQIFDQDILIILDENTPKAYFNVCQHRGHILVTELSGNKKRLTCPYHAWTYRLNGSLQAAPNTQNLEGFEAECIKLTSVQLEIFCGFIFINCDANATSMDNTFIDLKETILKVCPDIEDRYFVNQHHAEENCNWLLAVENYNECYHCKVVHRDFASGIIDPPSYNIAPFKDNKILHHFAKCASGKGSWYDTAGQDYNSFFFWPGSSIQIYPGGMINTYHWRPISANKSIVYRSWYSKDGKIDRDLQSVIDLDRTTTFYEDIELLNAVQKGLKNIGYNPGPLVCHKEQGIDSEHSVACIHQWIKQAEQKYVG